jgi:hypothetical protein
MATPRSRASFEKSPVGDTKKPGQLPRREETRREVFNRRFSQIAADFLSRGRKKISTTED